MSVRKVGKILLLCFAGLLGLVLLLMLGVKLALDRAPAYQAEIKEWVHAQTGYYIGFESVSPSFRWYGPELHFVRLELRSKDDRRVLAHAGDTSRKEAAMLLEWMRRRDARLDKEMKEALFKAGPIVAHYHYDEKI